MTALLVRFPWSDEVADALRAMPVDLVRAVDGSVGYAYTDGDATAWRARVRAWPAAALVLQTPLLDVAGASVDASAPYHYIVETDVEAGHEADFNAWYDTEHMPGLARVPGTVRARRLRNAEGSPRYHACYDLVAADVLGSPPWLAVRATPWSDRVRPTFRNTRRTMCVRVGESSR